jgi:4-hydroxy-3-polyprenylbenzoate decarboxylase
MAYPGLINFINALEEKNELLRISTFVDPVLEISEITDRVTKSSGKALLFENNGTDFPVLINSFGSDSRMAMSIGRKNLDDAGAEIENLFSRLTDNGGNIFKKLSSLPSLIRLAGIMPSRLGRKGSCQQVIHMEPDLGILPVLKCWPYDGGRFITLPMVHTVHPETGKTNVGMYRMQVLDKNTTGMHWQRHKTGANHFEAWKKCGRRMPVSVALGGDPVYTYASTAPLPENINEYILAGFLRGRKVKMVRCLTNELYVPSDADIILEGYVDPSEELIWEGPFGDHTGFYSLADWYPRFHVTCITHSRKAIYPATIVGIPPQEDVWLAKATERIFLSAVKMAIQPEIVDFHMPDAGVAHNLVIVKINKSYPGQGMKVLNSLFGAGQMMFSKYLVVVSGNIDIRNYYELLGHIFENADLSKDMLFTKGPLDVLDHASDNFSFGGKAGLDATIKHPEESNGRTADSMISSEKFSKWNTDFLKSGQISNYNSDLVKSDIPLLVLAVNISEDADVIEKVKIHLESGDPDSVFKLVIAVDHTVDPSDMHTVAWQLLGNSDPQRDHRFLSNGALLIDGTIKAFRKGGFPRKWPNVVCSDKDTISAVNEKWNLLGAGKLIESPSDKYRSLLRKGKDEISVDQVPC